MQIVLNSSPLIFLAKLSYLNQFIEYPDDFYIPQSVAEEISAKSDPASQSIQTLINAGKLRVRTSTLIMFEKYWANRIRYYTKLSPPAWKA
ncbi:PIN domain-containing protein [Nostoc sp.]|uniref:PIN domain-containing protein n=1 Tax=Nostoc sp. TaxID=1180 RepID=UPI002FF8E8D0